MILNMPGTLPSMVHFSGGSPNLCSLSRELGEISTARQPLCATGVPIVRGAHTGALIWDDDDVDMGASFSLP
jgi:hypothetical protein